MNILKKLFIKETPVPDVSTSQLCNELSFFDCFAKDLLQAKEEEVIESPYITLKRFEKLSSKFIRPLS